MSIGKTAIILAIGFLLFSLGRAVSYRFDGSRGPRLECTPLEMDLGNVPIGVSVERIFVLRDTGDERLLITDVKSTCQCTVAELPSRVIEPGRSAELNVTFRATSGGLKHQRVVIQTNSPADPALVLRVTAMASGSPATTSVP